MRAGLVLLFTLAILSPRVGFAFEYFVRCPKLAKDLTDRKDKALTSEPQSIYVFVGKDAAFAEKAKTLLPANCGKVEVPILEFQFSCKGCKNPFAELLAKYKAGGVSETALLEKLAEVNSGYEKAFIGELISEKNRAQQAVAPARPASGTRP